MSQVNISIARFAAQFQENNKPIEGVHPEKIYANDGIRHLMSQGVQAWWWEMR